MTTWEQILMICTSSPESLDRKFSQRSNLVGRKICLYNLLPRFRQNTRYPSLELSNSFDNIKNSIIERSFSSMLAKEEWIRTLNLISLKSLTFQDLQQRWLSPWFHASSVSVLHLNSCIIIIYIYTLFTFWISVNTLQLMSMGRTVATEMKCKH